jgi:hypothetical protein
MTGSFINIEIRVDHLEVFGGVCFRKKTGLVVGVFVILL